MDILIKLWILTRTNPFKYPKKGPFERNHPMINSYVKEITSLYGEKKVTELSCKSFKIPSTWMEWRAKCLIFLRNPEAGEEEERRILATWVDSYGGASNSRDERVEALIKTMAASKITDEPSPNIPVSHVEKLNEEFHRAIKVIQKEFDERMKRKEEDFGRALRAVRERQEAVALLLKSNGGMRK